jgi:predicted amidophosphoribosyltransferase
MSRDQSGNCRCPYCEGTQEKDNPVCSPCGVTVRRCEKCGKPLPREARECPDCGRGQGDQSRRNR